MYTPWDSVNVYSCSQESHLALSLPSLGHQVCFCVDGGGGVCVWIQSISFTYNCLISSPTPHFGRAELPLLRNLCLWLLPVPISFSYYSVRFFLSYLNDSSLQRSKYLLSSFKAGMVIRGKMDAPPCAVEQNLRKAPRLIRLPAYLPTGKGPAIY